jgi:hypothetical protein
MIPVAHPEAAVLMQPLFRSVGEAPRYIGGVSRDPATLPLFSVDHDENKESNEPPTSDHDRPIE